MASLTSHLKHKHKDKREVAVALMEENRSTRNKLFTIIRNNGMAKTNKVECQKHSPTFERKRKSKAKKGKVVMCSVCKTVLLSKNMARHKRTCSDTTKIRSIEVTTLSMDSHFTDQFKTNVLGTLRNDEISSLIRKDNGILLVGIFRYNKVKQRQDKSMEIRRSVRNDMRRLAHLYKVFKCFKPPCERYLNSVDMFNKENFLSLKKAIDSYVSNGDDIKAGLSHGINFLLTAAAKILEGHFLSTKKENEAFIITNFLSVYKLWSEDIFGDAYYKLNKNRLRKNRKPQALPLQADLMKIKDYCIEFIHEVYSKPFDLILTPVYVKLRNIICARLTLFNARRGGEAARMLLAEFNEANRNEWINDEDARSIDDLTKEIVNNSKIAYLMGKGSKSLVPLIIQKDLWKGMEILTNTDIRRLCGISDANPFVFAPTNSSQKSVQNHLSGWHAIDTICSNLELTERSRISATKNRHYVSSHFF